MVAMAMAMEAYEGFLKKKKMNLGNQKTAKKGRGGVLGNYNARSNFNPSQSPMRILG